MISIGMPPVNAIRSDCAATGPGILETFLIAEDR